MKKQFVAFVCSGLWSTLSLATPIVHTSDFIDDANRSHFNSFENIPSKNGLYNGGSGPYIEDGIRVEQINGDAGDSILVNYDPGGRDGQYSWYPIGGDRGYTQISLASGLDFDDVGFLIGSGIIPARGPAYFELLNDGIRILASSITHQSAFHYLGFEGGGFDTIRLWDGANGTSVPINTLFLDAIETRTRTSAVPEPGVLSMLGLGLLGLGATRYGRASRRIASTG
jgi:hypothetical protein